MNVRVLVLTTCGLGLIRPAPGTWSSLPVPVIACAAASLGMSDAALAIILIAICIVASIACVVLGEFAEEHWGKKDPGAVTIDEIAGQSIALIALPWRTQDDPDWLMWNVALAAAAFVAFRFFDIVKVPPVSQVQRVPGGWGILLDDIIAGLYAVAATHLFAWYALPAII